MFERIFHHENTVLPSFISLASSVFISNLACLLLGRHRSSHFSFFLSLVLLFARDLWPNSLSTAQHCFRRRPASLSGIRACLAVWFLAATAVSFSPVIPPRIWQSLFCNRLELQVPVGWRETKPKETDDGRKIEINPNSVWWSECFYLTLVVVKIIGKKKSLLCAWSLFNVCEKWLYENIVYLRSREMVLY